MSKHQVPPSPAASGILYVLCGSVKAFSRSITSYVLVLRSDGAALPRKGPTETEEWEYKTPVSVPAFTRSLPAPWRGNGLLLICPCPVSVPACRRYYGVESKCHAMHFCGKNKARFPFAHLLSLLPLYPFPLRYKSPAQWTRPSANQLGRKFATRKEWKGSPLGPRGLERRRGRRGGGGQPARSTAMATKKGSRRGSPSARSYPPYGLAPR